MLQALIEGTREGTAGALVIRGEPGVGKTALLDELMDVASDVTVLRTQGLEVEAPLAFAALHRLLRPVDWARHHLPEPQARALRVAFGDEEGAAVEPFLVGVATLGVLTSAAEENPVLCVVDDAHWLDPASEGALRFVAHRLGADRVALLFATRDGGWGSFEPKSLRELRVAGLDAGASRSLLVDSLGHVDDAVLDRIVAETRGNPLALLELPVELTPDQLDGREALPSQLHLTERVEQVFLERCRRLPQPVQTVVLLAAADDSGEPEVLRRAATALGLGEADLQAAFDSGLLAEGPDSMSLRHPLVRSAVYQSATGAQRREVHQALAEALSGRGDPDREAWHRASAVEGPDPGVVDALERAGVRAQRRGGHLAALAAYERAAALCDDPARRAALTFAAARSAWACGQVGPAGALLSQAREETSDPLLVADVARLRGHIEVNLGSASEAHRIFVQAAEAVYSQDPGRALEIAVAAAVMRTFGAESSTPLPVIEELVVPAADDPPRTLCLRHTLDAMARVADGDWHAATVALDRALMWGGEVDDRDVLWNLANAALQLGADREQQQFYGYALSRARETGAVTAVVYCLQRLCFSHYLSGDLAAVRHSAEEAILLSRSIGQPAMTALPLAWLAMVGALQVRDDQDEHLAQVEELVATHRLGILADPVHDLARWARALSAAGSGDSVGALHHLTRFRLPVLARMSAAERIEAAVRAGDVATARSCTEELADFARATRRPWALATVALGRALTADDADVEALFEASLAHHAGAGRPLDAARVRLAYGEWLRRAQRRVDARPHLREASETFQDLHAEALVTRAGQELRASGETARRRDPSTLVKLTPTELQIARLVSAGLSNKEVAAQCWISPRTVAFHLRNVFAKAGVTSRGELAQLDLV